MVDQKQEELNRIQASPTDRQIALNYAGQLDYFKSQFFTIQGVPSLITKKSFIPSLERGVNDLAEEPFKSLYKKNNLNDLPSSDNYIIPPIIHQILIGPHSQEQFDKFRKTFIAQHPGWLYKLWTDEDIAKLTLMNRDSYERAPNYAVKADVLRYELLYLFGGVCVDIDCICVQPLNLLHRHYEFYAGLSEPGIIATAVIASISGHPILKNCIEKIKNDFHEGRLQFDALGSSYLTGSFKNCAPHCTAPVIAFPIDYFYPQIKQKRPNDCEGNGVLESVELLPETFIVRCAG